MNRIDLPRQIVDSELTFFNFFRLKMVFLIEKKSFGRAPFGFDFKGKAGKGSLDTSDSWSFIHFQIQWLVLPV